jgi:XTP/dITP diphosphohydrolase
LSETGHPAVLASGNPGKLRELQHALAGTGWTLSNQSDFGVPEANETGLTFVENALIKARNAAQHTGLAAIADDSGLVVPALGGAPGIYSARYSGRGDAGNNEKLLAAMRDFDGEQRRARFVCVLVLLRHADDPLPIIAEGCWEGFIANAPRGDKGFGYDPIFLPEGQIRHAAELSQDEKRTLSHRGKAVALLCQALHR